MRPVCLTSLVLLLACGAEPLAPAPVGASPKPATSASAVAPPVAKSSPVSRPLSSLGLETCAVLADGRVACWGDVGLANDPSRPVGSPVFIPSLTEAVSVRVGVDLACAVTREARAVCWSRRFKEAAKPFDLGLDRVVDLALYGVVVAVRDDGSVTAVARGGAASTPPVEVPLKDIVAVSAGDEHLCFLRRSGSILCHGKADLVGADDAKDAARTILDGAPLETVEVSGFQDAVSLDAGSSLTCAVDRSGRVACWGYHTAFPEETSRRAIAVDVSDAVEVAVGDDHACAVRKSGKIACWGNVPGHYGLGPAAVEIPGVSDAAHVASGAKLACAMRKTGGLACWGTTQRGALGDGHAAEVVLPHEVARIEGATAIAVASDAACARRGDGTLACWGASQCALSTEEPPANEANARVIEGITKAERLSLSHWTACATRAAGAPQCFCSTPRPASVIEDVLGLDGATFLEDFGGTGLALLRSGKVEIWDARTRLEKKPGHKARPKKRKTEAVPKLEDATALAAGERGTDFCAVRRSGHVACGVIAGPDGLHEAALKASEVVEVAGLDDAVSVVASGDLYAALRKNGAIVTWENKWLHGSPGSRAKPGELAPNAHLTAKPFAGIEGATSVAIGATVLCASLASGAVVCQGENGHGDCGSGDFAWVDKPTRVAGLEDAIAVGAGGHRVCALRKTGRVACWGDNREGAAGGTDPTEVIAPTEVRLPR